MISLKSMPLTRIRLKGSGCYMDGYAGCLASGVTLIIVLEGDGMCTVFYVYDGLDWT